MKHETHPNGKCIDVQKLSEFLSVKPKTIYDWVHRGYIPSYKLGRLVRFDLETVLNWLNEKKRKPYLFSN